MCVVCTGRIGTAKMKGTSTIKLSKLFKKLFHRNWRSHFLLSHKVGLGKSRIKSSMVLAADKN